MKELIEAILQIVDMFKDKANVDVLFRRNVIEIIVHQKNTAYERIVTEEQMVDMIEILHSTGYRFGFSGNEKGLKIVVFGGEWYG